MKYRLQVRSCEYEIFEEPDKCFEALIKGLNRFEQKGFKLDKIEGSDYFMKKGTEIVILKIQKEDD